MKLLTFVVFLLGLVFVLASDVEAQTVQAGIFNPSGNTIEVKAKPSSAVSNTNWAVTVTVRWLTSYGITLGSVSSSLNVSKQGSVGTDGSYSYQKFGTVAFSGLNWTANSENSLFTVPITGGTGTGTFEIVNDAWTSLNNGDFYFESNSADLTAYGSEYYQGSVSNVPLPVQLSSFIGSVNGKKVQLTWKTATEVNSSSFEIERRSAGAWEKIGAVSASGTSTAPCEYTYVDEMKNIGSKNILYRLKTIDNDGSFKYSNELEIVAIPQIYALENNFPNPFNPQTKIQYSLPENAKVRLVVFDIIGKQVAELVNQEQPAGYYEKTFTGANLASGLYLYRITAQAQGNSTFTQVKKMLLVK
jgi:hypothetical protein